MMQVAFDYQAFIRQEYGGISRYFCRLAPLINMHSDVLAKFIAPLHINAYLSSLPLEMVSGRKIRRIPKTGKILMAVNQLLAKPQFDRFRPDIIHETYYSPSNYTSDSTRRVVTVYDMIHERFPSMFQGEEFITEWKRRSLQRADQIICISRHTQQDLLELFDIPEDKVAVVHLGYDHFEESQGISSSSSNSVNGKPYLLFVGYRGEHKNFKGLLNAFASSNLMRDNFRIVCFGGGAFQNRELQQFRELGLDQEHLSQLGGSDNLLGSYYSSATAFVYPSFYEGFGIPPLEAMSVNCPVVCSSTSSIPEVVGDAGEYFDPSDTESIRAALEHVLTSSSRRKELIAKGKLQRSKFSWERTADETLGIYKEML